MYKMACIKWPMTWLFIAALFILAEVWKLAQCPFIGEWIGKLWHILIVLQKKEGIIHSVMMEIFQDTL